MTMPVVTEQQLRGQLQRWVSKVKGDRPLFFGIRSDLPYEGKASIAIHTRDFSVRDCRSDLEARALLQELNDAGQSGVLLFRIDQPKLGDDVRERLVSRRLLSLSAEDALLELFGARSIDPRIRASKVMIQALLGKATSGNCPKTSLGVLDMDFAWNVLLGREPSTPHRPDLPTLLKWSRDGDAWSMISQLDPALAEAFFEWLEQDTGPAMRSLADCSIRGRNQPELLLPLGLCMGALFGESKDEANETRNVARGRLESYLNGETIPAESARAWHRAAREVANALDFAGRRALCQEVDALLGALKAEPLAAELDFSEKALEAREDAFAEAVLSFLRRKGMNGAAELKANFDWLAAHALFSGQDGEGSQLAARMCCRLATWIKQRPASAPERNLGAWMRNYFEESAFVDRALARLTTAEVEGPLRRAFDKVRHQARSLRRDEQRAFAASLDAWLGDPELSPDVRGVEDVIDQLLVPLAKTDRLLVLVLDGMGCAEFREILEDVLAREWQPIAPEGMILPTLAAVPSVTNISRKALFSGKLDHEDPRSETAAFREHERLRSVSGTKPPRLFAKAELTQSGTMTLSEDMRKTMADAKSRVVGVVLNAIDDQLSGSDQLNLHWRVASIRLLNQILNLAVESQRTLVLLSDHGNITDLNQTDLIQEARGDGDRYRFTGGIKDAENEITLHGTRLSKATGKDEVIVAQTDAVRYSPRKAGYHGGATDREMVIPLAVFKPAGHETLPEGWDYVEFSHPGWWSWQNTESSGTAKTTTKKPKKAKQTPKQPEADPNLQLKLDSAGSSDSGEKSWTQSLEASAAFKDQWKAMGRTSLRADQVQQFLLLSQEYQGRIPQNELAKRLGYPSFRLRGLIALLRRLLNIDGYEIVYEDSDTRSVVFDIRLAEKQFDLDESR